MNLQQPVRIIGAGMSGLTAALYLHKNGVPVSLHEKEHTVGGRLSTTEIDGWPLDRGFQVLLTDYPMTKKYLDYEALDLQYFKAGASVFSKGSHYRIGNPLQDFSLAWPTLRYPWGSVGDKWRLALLTRQLINSSLSTIFSRPEQSTFSYLQAKGFSAPFIHSFFQPFFGGIFLEKELQTSSRMFEFVLKMFSTGAAAVPKKGIQEMANQLAAQLPSDQIFLEQKVQPLNPKLIRLEDGSELPAAAVLLAHEIPDNPKQTWNRCINIYFSTADPQLLDEPLIGLIADKESPVTNFHYLNEVPGGPSDKEKILSVTLLDPNEKYNPETAVKIAKETLAKHTGLQHLKAVHIFEIDRALPVHQEVKLEASEEEIKDAKGFYHCGDTLTAPSLNMAMRTGEKAAQRILKDLQSKSTA